jgi:F0F1-type ATP synthase assembly protein I
MKSQSLAPAKARQKPLSGTSRCVRIAADESRTRMTALEIIGYVLLGIVFCSYGIAMVVGLVAAFPWGIIGLLAIAGIGLLLIKVVRERLRNSEDNYYEKNVDQ